MTSTVTSARELWDSGHPDFVALVRVWEVEKRCPLPLADVLMEHGLDRQSEVAKWAATYPDRKCFFGNAPTGPYPFSGGVTCKWYTLHDSVCASDLNDMVPVKGFRDKSVTSPDFKTVTEALLFLLDSELVYD